MSIGGAIPTQALETHKGGRYGEEPKLAGIVQLAELLSATQALF